MKLTTQDQKRPVLSVDIIVQKDDKILLGALTDQWTHGGKYRYGLPGREIRFNETIRQAVERSIKEDTGCEVSEYNIIGVNANYAFDNHFIGIAVTAKIIGDPVVKKPEDWTHWEWFNVNDLPNKLFDAAKNAIDSFLTKTVTVSE